MSEHWSQQWSFSGEKSRMGGREGSSWVSVFPLPQWDYFTRLGPCLKSLGSQRLPSLSLQLRAEEMNAWRWEVPDALASSLATAKCIPLPSFSSGPFVLPSHRVATPLHLLFLLLKKPLPFTWRLVCRVSSGGTCRRSTETPRSDLWAQRPSGTALPSFFLFAKPLRAQIANHPASTWHTPWSHVCFAQWNLNQGPLAPSSKLLVHYYMASHSRTRHFFTEHAWIFFQSSLHDELNVCTVCN